MAKKKRRRVFGAATGTRKSKSKSLCPYCHTVHRVHALCRLKRIRSGRA
jgi:hypothetical protein